MCANIGIISDNYKCFAIKIRKYQYYFLHFLRKYRNVLHSKLRKYQYFISDALVFFDLVFKHLCKYTTFCEYKRIYKEKVVSLQR